MHHNNRMQQNSTQKTDNLIDLLLKGEALGPSQREEIVNSLKDLKRERNGLAFIVSRTRECCEGMLTLSKKYEDLKDDSDEHCIAKLKQFLKLADIRNMEYDKEGNILLSGGAKQRSNDIRRKEGLEKFEDMMTDFFIQLRTRSLNVFDMIGGDQKICSSFIKYLSQESGNLLDMMKLEIDSVLSNLPEKIVVVKEHVEQSDLDKEGGKELVTKAKNVTKNLRSALNEADCIKTDPDEDKEFDYVWNKLHEEAEKANDEPQGSQSEVIGQLNGLLSEKQQAIERMEEKVETQKMLHERVLRELKKENDILLRDNNNLKKEIKIKGGDDIRNGSKDKKRGRGGSRYEYEDVVRKNKLLARKIKERDNEIENFEEKILYLNQRIRDMEREQAHNRTLGGVNVYKKEEDDNDVNSIDPSFLDSARNKTRPARERTPTNIYKMDSEENRERDLIHRHKHQVDTHGRSKKPGNEGYRRDMQRYNEPQPPSKPTHEHNKNSLMRVIRTSSRSKNQPKHDHILESYLKKGVYKTMSKSPIKPHNSKNNSLENTYKASAGSPTDVSYQQRRRRKPLTSEMGNISCWAYFDKRKSQYSFMKRSGTKLRMGSPNKHTIYEKNKTTGEALTDKTTHFDRILCAESENHMVNTLGKAVIESLNKGGTSFLFIGKNDKLFLLQLILRLLVDEFGTRGTGHFLLTCSKNMASILETFFGDDDPNLPVHTFKVEANLFDLFGQVSDRLDEHMSCDEFFCQIEFHETRFSNPVTLLFAGCNPREELKKMIPSRRNELDQYKFLRHAILSNFKSTTDSTTLTMFIDKFISQDIKMVCTFTHLVTDYLYNDFLVDVSNQMRRSNVLMPSQRNPAMAGNVVRKSVGGTVPRNAGRSKRRTKTAMIGGHPHVQAPPSGVSAASNIDTKVKEASDHVRNIFRYIH